MERGKKTRDEGENGEREKGRGGRKNEGGRGR
jgi:hypothetical protein